MRCEEITFVILTLNEAKRLERALRSVPSSAKIYVLDAHSADATIEIAARYNATVETRQWTNFADARRHALTKVTTPWVFMLDADEALDAMLVHALETCDASAAGYRMHRANRFCGRIMQYGPWANERIVRLARTDAASIAAHASGGLHEYLAVRGRIAQIDGMLDHDSYPSVASYLRKFGRYTRIEAESASSTPMTVLLAIPLGLAKFLRSMLLRGAYRDGWRGMFVAAASAIYPIVVAARALRYAAQRKSQQ